jgi:hypothetical protein
MHFHIEQDLPATKKSEEREFIEQERVRKHYKKLRKVRVEKGA